MEETGSKLGHLILSILSITNHLSQNHYYHYLNLIILCNTTFHSYHDIALFLIIFQSINFSVFLNLKYLLFFSNFFNRYKYLMTENEYVEDELVDISDVGAFHSVPRQEVAPISLSSFGSSTIFCPSSHFNNIYACNLFPRNINFVYSNLQGMLEGCHFEEFTNEVSRTRAIHVYALVETWLRRGINSNKSVGIRGFKVFRSDRVSRISDRNKGGGVALYVKDGLQCVILVRSQDDNCGIENAEFIFSKINCKFGCIFVAVIYRTSKCNATHSQKLFELIVSASANFTHVVILGDMNIDISHNSNELGVLNGYFHIVNHPCPTHNWPNATPTLIDIILTRKINSIKRFSHYNLITTTHHDLILVSYKLAPEIRREPSSFQFRDYNAIDHSDLFSAASMIDWNKSRCVSHIDEMVGFFNENYFKLFNDFVPISTVKLKCESKPWFSRELNLAMNERKKLYDQYRRCPSEVKPEYCSLYRSKCVQVKNAINSLKRKHFLNSVNAAKTMKQRWNVLRTTGCCRESNSVVSGHDLNVNDLNEHFSKIHASSLSQLPNLMRLISVSVFDFRPFIPSDVLGALHKITSDAVGHDGIGRKFLKLVLPHFLDEIVRIFNHSMKTGTLPEVWKMAIIRPICKVNNPMSPADTRPITINSVMLKIMVYILNAQLKLFIESNDILSPLQSGFRNHHSCTTAMVKVSDDVRSSIALNKVTVMVLLDIKSAYASVSHALILHIMKHIGMGPKSLKWLENFLTTKSQYVEVDGIKSNPININCGLMQGDNLSQTIFSIVINGVVDVITQCNKHLYADDLSIYRDCYLEYLNDTIAVVNDQIDAINQWIFDRGMALNPLKTQAIVIGPKHLINKINFQDLPRIRVISTDIDFSQSVKYLGFLFNQNFDSRDHVDSIIRKVNFSLGNLRHARNKIPRGCKEQIVKGTIIPIFDYGSILYHGFGIHGSGQDEHRLQIAQNNCVRFVLNVFKFDHISPFYEELRLLNLYNRRSVFICCFIHKCMYFDTPRYLNSLFSINRNNTRAGQDTVSLLVRKVGRTRDEFLMAHCASKLWNSLPGVIRSIRNEKSFKIEVSTYFSNLQFRESTNSTSNT